MTIAICDGILKAGLDADENTMKTAMITSMQLWDTNILMQDMEEDFTAGLHWKRRSLITVGVMVLQ